MKGKKALEPALFVFMSLCISFEASSVYCPNLMRSYDIEKRSKRKASNDPTDPTHKKAKEPSQVKANPSADNLVKMGVKWKNARPTNVEDIGDFQAAFHDLLDKGSAALKINSIGSLDYQGKHGLSSNGSWIMSFFHSNSPKKERISIDHPIKIGSLTKQFIAVAILLLEEEGRLNSQP